MKYELDNSINLNKAIINTIIEENRDIINLFYLSSSITTLKKNLKSFLLSKLDIDSLNYYKNKIHKDNNAFNKISWKNKGIIRLLDYIDNDGLTIKDQNLRGKKIVSQPITTLYKVLRENKVAHNDFLYDMLYLLRQINGKLKENIPKKQKILQWINRHHSGLENEIIKLRDRNKKRIITKIIQKLDSGEIHKQGFYLDKNLNFEQKYEIVQHWWDSSEKFHLRFAFRDYKLLNEMLDFSLDDQTLENLKKAQEKGIPLFVNPYYASLLLVNPPKKYEHIDQPIRSYIFSSKNLIDEFGNIVAWEKEDIIEPNKPNSAGWLLPKGDVVHRRYPEVAILIPKTRGRTCGGLCVSCQRMYGFQKKELNFDLDNSAHNKESWNQELPKILEYFENDSQLRDILITGGDALMNTNKQLKQIFDEIYKMAIRKNEANKNRTEKYAPISRIRLGSRLLAYIPQRVTDDLVEILKEFKLKASEIGIEQFIIQTHFESAIEVTPDVKRAVEKIINAGWIVTNQNVFTPAVSIRGHISYLRKILNSIGILPYYTFSVKGFMENSDNFSTNARMAQEINEEKIIGKYNKLADEKIAKFLQNSNNIISNIKLIKEEFNLPFLATDRSVMNLPAVGKSLSFRTIGITDDGRRVLEFEYDYTRKHSPIINKLGKIIITESKSIYKYLKQIEKYGENLKEYETIWGYSISQTEPRASIYKYPEYNYKITNKITNIIL